MKQEIISTGKGLAITGTAASVAWLTDVTDIAKAITVILAMLVVLAQLIYYTVKTYRYVRNKNASP